MQQPRVTLDALKRSKTAGRKIVMLTAYDYPFARLVDEAGVDIVLVGDSLGMVVLGRPDTTSVTLADMVRHTQAVRRGTSRALLVADMPYPSLHGPSADLAADAMVLVRDAGCDAVKVEWAEGIVPKVKQAVASGIAVMGHVGLTPQTAASQEGGFGMRGKDAASAARIIEQAAQLSSAGCFALVLECVPAELAKMITGQVTAPTIGIGSGPYCDGQVLVLHDVLGLYEPFSPRFAKRYAALSETVRASVQQYAQEVRAGAFPSKAQTVRMASDQLEQLQRLLKSA